MKNESPAITKISLLIDFKTSIGAEVDWFFLSVTVCLGILSIGRFTSNNKKIRMVIRKM